MRSLLLLGVLSLGVLLSPTPAAASGDRETPEPRVSVQEAAQREQAVVPVTFTCREEVALPDTVVVPSARPVATASTAPASSAVRRLPATGPAYKPTRQKRPPNTAGASPLRVWML